MEIDALHQKMLKKKLWVVITKPIAPREAVMTFMKAHLEHQIRLEKAGILFGAGPASLPDSSTPSFGLVIIRAKDADEARQIADSDPMHVNKVRSYELYSWSLNEGRLGITVDYSDQSYRID